MRSVGGERRFSWILLSLCLLSCMVAALIVLVQRPGAIAATSTPINASRRSPPLQAVFRPCSTSAPCLAVVIDDLGRQLGPLERLLALSTELTFSVLPHAKQSVRTAEKVRGAHRELWLHLPMVPRDRQLITDEPVVLSPDSNIEAVLADALGRVGPVSGINNHMGSAFARNRQAVSRLMHHLARRRLPFLDSRTDSSSLFCAEAARIGGGCLSRDVFLDDPGDSATVEYRLEEAVQLARRRGWAVVIGHPHRRTIDALVRFDPGARGVELRRLSRFFRRSP